MIGVVTALGTAAGLVAAAPEAAAVPSQTLQWGACEHPLPLDPSAQCADVEVPRDYAEPDGPTITVTVSRIAARDQANRRGVLFGNPGGPGGDGLSMFSSHLPPEQVRDQWDLIAVQPRGLVGGTPVDCAEAAETDDVLFSAGQVQRDRCEQGTPGYTTTLTTENTARDMEAVRQAIGEERVSLYGVSYGTLLMSTYATLFPRHTDRLILDSAVDTDWLWNGVLAAQTQPYKARVHDMMAWIADNNEIYGLGTTALQVYRKWSAKVTEEAGVPASLLAPPAEVGDVPPGLAAVAQQYIDGVNLSAEARARFENFVATLLNPGKVQANSSLLQVTRGAAPDRNQWPLVAMMVQGRIADEALSITPEIESVMMTAAVMQSLILCNENQVAARPEQTPAALYQMLFAGDIFDLPGLVYESGLACAGAAPVADLVPIANKGLAVQPLLIQSQRDPQTPYSGALKMQRQMGAHLITVGGGDHGQIGRANAPLDDAIAEYLRTGSTGTTTAPQAPITAALNEIPGGPVGIHGTRLTRW